MSVSLWRSFFINRTQIIYFTINYSIYMNFWRYDFYELSFIKAHQGKSKKQFVIWPQKKQYFQLKLPHHIEYFNIGNNKGGFCWLKRQTKPLKREKRNSTTAYRAIRYAVVLSLNLMIKLYSEMAALISSAAFLPLMSMPPKIGPMRKLPLTPLAAIPETNSPG